MAVIVSAKDVDRSVKMFEGATKAEIAWLGGLFEGEGCTNTQSKGRDRTKRYLNVRIVIRELEVLERVASIVKRGAIYCNPNVNYPSYSPIYEWVLCREEEVLEFLDRLWPWLSQRRRQQIMDCEEDCGR